MEIPSINSIIQKETERQAAELSLVASENYVSQAVLAALGSSLTNKYAEGYPGKRYYGGNSVIDELELRTIQLAQDLFQTDYHVNVQPYSGSPANFAVYSALLKPGDKVLALSLDAGGHLTHGHKVSLSGTFYTFIHYGVQAETELIDYDQVLELAKEHRPALIVCGTTAYPAQVDYAQFARIAREVGAWLMVDMAHVAGLVAGKAHPTPFDQADVITTTTHKSLRGPRSGVIFCRKEFAKAIDRAVFPGLQGGPHMNTIAAVGVALEEALQPQFSMYAKQCVQNAKTLAFHFQQAGFRLVADGTDTHLLLLDLTSTSLRGTAAQQLLEDSGIITNKNAIPFDPNPPTDPSGLRLGTLGVTSRGMKEREMEQLAHLIIQLLREPNTATDVTASTLALAKKFRIPSHY